MSEAAGEIGDPQVRNRGTLGGSLAHADPSADYPAVMLALDAEIQHHGPERLAGRSRPATSSRICSRSISRPDELITGVQFAPVKSAAYAKLHQRASHYAIVGVAAALDVKNGTIQSARVGLTGASSHATRLTNVEQALAGQPLSPATIESAAQVAGTDLKEINADIHASEELPPRDDSGLYQARS